MIRQWLTVVVLLVGCRAACAEWVWVPEEGPIEIIERVAPIFTGDNGSVTYLAGNVTEITGDFNTSNVRLIDPDLDALVEGARGDATLAPNSADPVHSAQIMIRYWDEQQGTETIRRGWFKVFRTVGTMEHIYMSGYLDAALELVDLANLTHDAGLQPTYVSSVPNPTIKANGSAHVQDLIDKLYGTPYSAASFVLGVSKEGTNWSIGFDQVNASFNAIVAYSTQAYGEGSMTAAVYYAIKTAVLNARAEFAFQVDEAVHGDNCMQIVDDLESDITGWEYYGAITDAEIAATLRACCQVVSGACETNSNYYLPVTWGMAGF